MTILETKKQSHKGVRLCEDFEEYIIILPKQLKYIKNIVLKQLQKNHTKRVKIVDNTRTVWYYNIKNRTTSTKKGGQRYEEILKRNESN